MFGAARLSYQELNLRADRLAAHLQTHGVVSARGRYLRGAFSGDGDRRSRHPEGRA